MGNVVGLGAILLWQWLTIFKSSLFSLSTGGSSVPPSMAFTLYCLGLCGAFFILSRWGSRLSDREFRIVMWGAGAAMAFVWLPAGASMRDIPAAGPALFLALPAVGSATHLVAWEWRLCGSTFPRQAMAFGSASFVRTIGVIVLTMLFPSFFPQGALLLPFLSAALWTPPARDPGASEPQTPDLPLRHPVFPPRLALRAVIFFAISALFLSISLARRSPDMLLAEAWSDPLYTLGALAVGLFLVRFPGAELRRIYLGSEISLILGFMVFAALGEGDPKIPLVFLQFGAGIFGAYFITLFLYLGGRAGREQSLRIVATGQMVIMGAVVLGILLTKTIGAFAFRYGVPFVLATSLLGVGLLFLSRCFFGDDQETFAGYALADVTGNPEPEAPVFSGEETVSPRAIEAKLSRQEMRVALLVVKGFRNEDMSRELNVTGNTIRSHLKNIHRKMGSSNRKELQSILQGMAGTASSVMVLERRETGFADSVPEGSIPELRFPKYLEDPSRLSGERENQPPDTPSMGSRKARG